jgi:hypothetical protein
MFLSDEEYNARLNSGRNLLNHSAETPVENRVQIKTIHEGSGRTQGTENVPRLIQELTGVMANIEGPSKAAKAFGVSPT